MGVSFETALEGLERYCRAKGWCGADCYDALNSTWLKSSRFYRSRVVRTVWTQTFRRSPIDLRPLARVPAEDNPKALALFILGMAETERSHPDPARRQELRDLALRLMALRCDHPAGRAGWGSGPVSCSKMLAVTSYR